MGHRPEPTKPPILPLHPSVLERMFYRRQEWEERYRPSDPPGNASHLQPDIGTANGQLLEFLAPMFNAKLALDLGTCVGYSAHVLAQIVGAEGQVLSVERDPDLAKQARENLKQEGLDRRVAVIMGESSEVLGGLTGPFDLILLDVDKNEYLDLLDRLIDLLAEGGHLLVDDIGFISRDFVPRLRHLSVHMARFVQALLEREDMKTVYVPLGDGLLLSRKRARTDKTQLSMFDSHSPRHTRE